MLVNNKSELREETFLTLYVVRSGRYDTGTIL